MATFPLAGKRSVVYGLGKSGLSAIRLLISQGSSVSAVDDRPLEELGSASDQLTQLGVRFVPAKEAKLEGVELVVVSPGVPWALPALARARATGVAVWAEVELAYRLISQGRFFGITGTNGKSTTTALTGELFRRGGASVFVGGNLGTPLCDAALGRPFDVHVVELSSFQLEGIDELTCEGAAWLNLTPDHLDRYPSTQAYGAAKARIFKNQRSSDFAVINADDPAVVEHSGSVGGKRDGFSSAGLARGASPWRRLARRCPGGFELIEGGERSLHRFTLSNRALRGRHNLENAMAATLLAYGGGVDPAAIQSGLDRFPGLPHRLEQVRVLDGVEWINDSKATNVDSVLVALEAIDQGLWLIAGGKGKGAPYRPLVDAAKGKVKGVLTIGQDARTIEDAFAGQAAVHPCHTLEQAVGLARKLATLGDVVLLSPACASYDQFKNFEDRGEVFKRLVWSL